MEAVLHELTQKRKELRQAADIVYIVNAGLINQVKSSLLNSLLGRGEVFRGSGSRETNISQIEPYCQNAYLVDTPGFNADGANDAEICGIYEKACFILFVHSVKTGDLQRQEIDCLRTIANVVGEKYFWQHVALILTFSEECEEEQIAAIRTRIEQTIAGQFKQKMGVFLVSNACFVKAQRADDSEKKALYLERSGIPELQKYLTAHLAQWQRDNRQLQAERFQEAQKTALGKMSLRHGGTLMKIYQKRAEYAKLKNELQRLYYQARNKIYGLKARFSDAENSAQTAEKELSNLREQHEQEKAKY